MIAADLTFDRQALLEKIRVAMKSARFQHVLGVEQAALALADQYGCDPKKPVWQHFCMIMPRKWKTKSFWT